MGRQTKYYLERYTFLSPITILVQFFGGDLLDRNYIYSHKSGEGLQ